MTIRTSHQRFPAVPFLFVLTIILVSALTFGWIRESSLEKISVAGQGFFTRFKMPAPEPARLAPSHPNGPSELQVAALLDRGAFAPGDEIEGQDSRAPQDIKELDPRSLAFESGDWFTYLRLTYLNPLAQLSFTASMTALIILVMWLLYFRRIDVFGSSSFIELLFTMALGAFFAFFALILGDVVDRWLPALPLSGWSYDLAFSVIRIGVVEELVKFAPVLLVVLVANRNKQPLDLLILGSMSALGFSTLENALYFSTHGLGIAFSRFLFSTLMHLATTSIVCYVWARARAFQRGSHLKAALAGLLLAALVHGVYDFFVLKPSSKSAVLGFVVVLFMAREYNRMLRNALNLTPLGEPLVVDHSRLSNFSLLVSTVGFLLLIGFLYNNFEYDTQMAFQQLKMMGLYSLPVQISLFASLGKIVLEPGKFKPLFKLPSLDRHPADISLSYH
ncbi:MAG: PrsW family glutamic-type intramembrane protease [Anaerolineales bacterium]